MFKTVFNGKCSFCKALLPINRLLPVVKPLTEWEMVKIGAYVCSNVACRSKVESPWVVEKHVE